jgi:hypothetical protein
VSKTVSSHILGCVDGDDLGFGTLDGELEPPPLSSAMEFSARPLLLTGWLRKKQPDRLLRDERPILEREKWFRVFNPSPPSGNQRLAVNVVGGPERRGLGP